MNDINHMTGPASYLHADVRCLHVQADIVRTVKSVFEHLTPQSKAVWSEMHKYSFPVEIM